MIRNLIFDFDGTLADTTEGIVITTQETLRVMGLPVVTAERFRPVIGLSLRDCFKYGTETPEERLDEATEVYRRIFDGIAVPRTTLYEGVPETLEALRGCGMRLGIATSRSGRTLRMLLDVLGIRDFFSELAATDEVEHPKPAPDLALLLMERLGARPEETVVIGDTVYDLQMGRAAGCRTVGVTWGNQPREQILTASPDWTVDRFPALLDILR